MSSSFTVGIPKEQDGVEQRAILIPSAVERLVKKGAAVIIESGMGDRAGFADTAYAAIGAVIASSRQAVLSQADMVIRLSQPTEEDITCLKTGSMHICLNISEPTLLEQLLARSIHVMNLVRIPRTTRAQKMDVLSSQANLAGYVAVILAAERLRKIFPLMMTPAGTISPARVFVIGAGVAGLQAIATAKRLGARVEAFDTRPAVEEQVMSLGAKFVKVDMGETGEAQGGYAKALNEEQLAKQRDVMKTHCAASDVVITTAQVFGKKAPILITRDMIEAMRPGSVVVDLAVESGGNVEGIVYNEEIFHNGVRLVGLAHLPGHVVQDASQVLSANIMAFIDEYWDNETKRFVIKQDDILDACLITTV